MSTCGGHDGKTSENLVPRLVILGLDLGWWKEDEEKQTMA